LPTNFLPTNFESPPIFAMAEQFQGRGKDDSMITTVWRNPDPSDGPLSITFQHSGDFSGEVRINLDQVLVETQVAGSQEWAQVSMPFDALKMLVAQYVARQRIGHLEQASADEILGVEQP
jgi:hypothetical protein